MGELHYLTIIVNSYYEFYIYTYLTYSANFGAIIFLINLSVTYI